MTTIAVHPGSDLRLHGIVSFDVTDLPKLPHGSGARIQIIATQDGQVVYGEARNVSEQPFTLGGSSSLWLQNGGPAHCVATLYYWTFHPTEVFHSLAECAFEATG